MVGLTVFEMILKWSEQILIEEGPLNVGRRTTIKGLSERTQTVGNSGVASQTDTLICITIMSHDRF